MCIYHTAFTGQFWLQKHRFYACTPILNFSALSHRIKQNTLYDQCLESSNNTSSVVKHPTLKSQLDWGPGYSVTSFPGWSTPVCESTGKQLCDVNDALSNWWHSHCAWHHVTQHVLFRSAIRSERRVFFPALLRVMPRQYARLLYLAYNCRVAHSVSTHGVALPCTVWVGHSLQQSCSTKMLQLFIVKNSPAFGPPCVCLCAQKKDGTWGPLLPLTFVTVISNCCMLNTMWRVQSTMYTVQCHVL